MAETPARTPDAANSAASGAPSAKEAQKVELDLDDAPFLEDEAAPTKETPAPPPEKDSEKLPEPPQPSSGQSLKERLSARKKQLLLAGLSLVALLAAGAGARFYFSRPAPPPETPVRRIVVPDKPPPLPAADTAKYQLAWDAFWVEQRDTEGAIRFFVCEFTVPTDNVQLYNEMRLKTVVLRDALFYYLRNRPFTLFSDPKVMAQLKSELMTVINEHVASGKIEDIFIVNCLVK